MSCLRAGFGWLLSSCWLLAHCVVTKPILAQSTTQMASFHMQPQQVLPGTTIIWFSSTRAGKDSLIQARHCQFASNTDSIMLVTLTQDGWCAVAVACKRFTWAALTGTGRLEKCCLLQVIQQRAVRLANPLVVLLLLGALPGAV
jgi:hypothetical protein